MSDLQSFPKSYRAAGLILLVGLLATGYVGYSVKSEIDLDVQRQFASDCDETQLKIEGRLQAHKQVLLGGAALFDASDSVNRNEWRVYAQRVEIDQHFNGIQGLGFSLWIPKNKLAQHISEIRRQGFPEYSVNPVGERGVYSSIIYLEPFKERNLRAFGYDMYSEPVRRAAMEQARDENVISLSGKVTLVQENGKDVQAGTLMYVPVYLKSMPLATVEQRRAALHGWVYSPFRMDDLLHGVLQRWDNPQNRFLRLQVYDGHGTNADSLLYHSEVSQEATSSAPVLFTLERHMNFNGHEWTLHFEQLQGRVSGTDYSKAWMILTGGMGLSILSCFLMLSYLNTRRNAAQIADELTAESRKASRYVRSLIEASPDPLVTISPEGKITDVNHATEKVTGRSRSELLGTDFSDYFTEPDKARAGYQQVFLQGNVTDYPLVIRHRDGHVTDVLYNASIYRNEAGAVLGVFAIARDVTERNNAEFVLRQSEDALKEAQRMAHVGSWHMDLATNEVVWSEVLYKMYGFDPALPPPLYTESMKLFTPESWESLSTSIARAVESGIPYELELEMVPKDGGRKWMLARGELVRDASGVPVRVRGVVMDITERKLADNAIREKEERLILATVNNGVGIWDWNLQTQEMIWDDSMYALYHIRREDFSGTEEAWRASLHPDDLARGDQEVANAIAGKKPFESEFRVVWPNGEIHYIKAVAKVFRDDQGTPLRMLGINMDVSDRKKAEDKINELNRDLERRVDERTAQLEAANKELESFSYSVSHDLRSPLRAIDGFSHILLEDYADKLDEEGKRLLNVVRDNTRRMGQLIDDILKFSRTGRLELNFSEIDMEGMARSVVEELQSVAVTGRKPQVEIEHLPSVKGDLSMMHQVFVNLLSNAIKFTGSKESAMIKVGGSIEGNEAVYYVKDNGAGFDMQYADKLFGVFQRLHATNEFEGTGIGLAIVKRIVIRHGGRVWAEGKVNEGATLYFSIPIQILVQREAL